MVKYNLIATIVVAHFINGSETSEMHFEGVDRPQRQASCLVRDVSPVIARKCRAVESSERPHHHQVRHASQKIGRIMCWEGDALGVQGFPTTEMYTYIASFSRIEGSSQSR